MKAKELIEILSTRPDAEVIVSAPFESSLDQHGLQIEQRIEGVTILPCFWSRPGVESQPIVITAKP